MRRIVMVGLVTMAVLAATTGGAQTLTGTLKKVQDSGTLTVGYRENALPFSFTGSDGKPAGYSIDLCQEIAVAVQQELKLPSLAVRWVPVTPENRVDAVANGTVDIECGTTTASLSRQEKVDFTLMTFVDGASLLIAEGSGIRTATDLAGKRVGVVPGTTTEKAVGDFLRRRSIGGDDRAHEGPRRGPRGAPDLQDRGVRAPTASSWSAWCSRPGARPATRWSPTTSPTSPTASWSGVTTRRSVS